MARPPLKTAQLLHGPYQPPPFRYGDVVMDVVRGEVVIVGLSGAPIPWPIGKRGRTKSLVVFAGLADAVRMESNIAVCRWWGITPQTVSKWRKALEVGPVTEGTRALLRANSLLTIRTAEAQAKCRAKDRDPTRCSKISANKRGVPKPPHVRAVLMANLAKGHTPQARRKAAEANRRRKARPPMAGPAWLPEEEELLERLAPAEVAQETGRSLSAVYSRRSVRRMADGRCRRWHGYGGGG